MLNIITLDYSTVSGPSKVVLNLIKGLNKIKYPYVINKDINSTKRCYIPNRRAALPLIKKAKSKIIVGPNLYVLPNEIQWFIDFKDCIYVQPCQWALDLWKMLGFERATLKIWPVGIDTDSFYPQKSSQKKVTIYHKKRSKEELYVIENVLKKMNISYQKINFGNYDEESYRNILQNTSFMIWHGCHESQGIALQECLSSDIPVLVYDVRTLFEETGKAYYWPKQLNRFKVTAAPYFNSTCGLIINDLEQLKQSIEYMFDNLNKFSPREFILENLSLEKQAKDLIALYDQFGLNLQEGYQEHLLNKKDLSSAKYIKYSENLLNRFINIKKKLKNYV